MPMRCPRDEDDRVAWRGKRDCGGEPPRDRERQQCVRARQQKMEPIFLAHRVISDAGSNDHARMALHHAIILDGRRRGSGGQFGAEHGHDGLFRVCLSPRSDPDKNKAACAEKALRSSWYDKTEAWAEIILREENRLGEACCGAK